jgi:transcription elongation factor Elf1
MSSDMERQKAVREFYEKRENAYRCMKCNGEYDRYNNFARVRGSITDWRSSFLIHWLFYCDTCSAWICDKCLGKNHSRVNINDDMIVCPVCGHEYIILRSELSKPHYIKRD